MEMQDKNTPKAKIQRILRRDLKYKDEEQIEVLKSCLFDIEEKRRLEKEKEDAWLKVKEDRKAKLAEQLRIHGFKPVRFKKPLPPLEDRRQYTRCCKRCDEYYRTFSKYGEICDGCKQGGKSDGVPHEMNNLVK